MDWGTRLTAQRQLCDPAQHRLSIQAAPKAPAQRAHGALSSWTKAVLGLVSKLMIKSVSRMQLCFKELVKKIFWKEVLMESL